MDLFKAIHKMNCYGNDKQPFLFIIDYNMENILVYDLKEVPKNIWYDINTISNRTSKPEKLAEIKFEKYPLSFESYLNSFNIVQKHLKAGNTYLLNLTAKTPIEINYSLDEIFDTSKAPFKLKYKDDFVVFSPEKFIEIIGNTISTFPMKGTIDASVKNAKEIILNDEKETSEHATIVDLLRNDISQIATNVCVEKYRYIDKIQTNANTILQVSSKITGQLERNWHSTIGDLLMKLLPAGSVTGAPKKKTLDIIQEAENYERGYYTGVFGIYDGKDLSSAVMIRFIENEQGKLYYKSGGGITAQSLAEKEYHELIQKIYVPVS